MSKIKAVLAESKCPLFLYVNDKETASKVGPITARFFREPGSNIGFVTNVPNPKALTEVGNAVEVNPELNNDVSAQDLAELDRMKDSEGNTVYMDSELAFDVTTLNEKIHSPLTGNLVTLSYASDEEDTSSEGDEDDSSEEDDADTGDDESSDDADDSGIEELDLELEDDTSEDDDSSESDENSDEDSDDSSEEEDSEGEDDSEDVSGDDDEEEASDKETETVQESVDVSVIDTVDTAKALRVIDIANNEYAIFVGDKFVGNLKQTEAVETAAFLYSDGNKLYRTFKDRWNHCAKSGNYSELASLGFVPAVVSVNINDITLRMIAKEVAAAVETASVDQVAYKKRTEKIISLAMVGMAKGVFAKDNALVSEIATVLRRSNIQNADGQARRILAKAAPSFASAVLEQATELESKTDAHLNGITEVVSKADFKSVEEDSADIGQLSTAFGDTPAAEREVASFVPSKDKQAKPNKYGNLFSRKF